jgi:hypothetical protein
MRKKFSEGKSGLFALGYIQNQGTYLTEISYLARANVTAAELDENIQKAYEAGSEINYYYDGSGN